MMRIQDGRRGVVRGFSLAAAAMLVLSTVPDQRAEALSLANPASVPAAKHASDGLTTKVRGGHGGHGGHGGGGFRGGGGGFHGGGFRGGGAAIHAGGFRHGGAEFRGGGLRAAPVFHGGFRHGGHRFAHRRHFPRHFYYAPSYVYYPHRYCRIVWTYYGPRKICRYRPWHHHWRYHRHHRHPIYW